ncbi:MAG: sulfite exporter TauE/SafE family protein [Bryobacteraceae bacterium]
MTSALLLMSFVVGLLVGLTSMGGAALMTPFLILVLGVRPMLAVGTDLVYGSLTKIAGAWMHYRQGTVDLKVCFRMAIGSVPGGILGVLTITRLHAAGVDIDYYVRHALGVALLMVALLVVAKALGYEIPARHTAWILRHRDTSTVVWGAFVGFAVGMTSVGSGSLIAPFLLIIMPGRSARVIGTDVFHAAILVSATAFVHQQAGNVDWNLVPTLLCGSIPGVLIGSYLAPRMPDRVLRLGLAVLLFATGWKLV